MYQAVSMSEKYMEIAKFSQKNNRIPTALLQAMLHMNRHINSHGKWADSDQQAHQQKLMRFAFHRRSRPH